MADVRGTAYLDTPNAFKFRTEYDPACTCHGHPWEAEAQERHRQLAEAEAAARPAARTAEAVVTAQAAQDPQRPVELAALNPGIAVLPQPPESAVKVGTPPDSVVATTPSVKTKGKSKQATRTKGADTETPSQPATLRTAAGSKVIGKGQKIVVVKTVTATKKAAHVAHKTEPLSAAVRPLVPRVVVAQVKADGGQRSFRSDEYWRLSYWETRN